MQRMRPARIFSPTCFLWTIAATAVLWLASPQPVSAQTADLQTLTQRIERLQRDLRTLEKDYYRGEKTGANRTAAAQRASGPITGGQLANAEIRMSNLEEEMRVLTGQLEEVRHQMRTMLKRLDNLVKDADFRLTEIENKLAAQPAQAPSGTDVDGAAPPASAPPANAAAQQAPQQEQATETASTSALPAGTPMDQYNYAYSLLTKAQLDEAEAAFQEFLVQHGDDKLAGNAQFWLGQTYFTQERYSEAARTFLTGIQRYPNSNKAPDTMLKLGVTLGKLNQKEEACSTFREMQSQFPNLRNRLRKTLQQEIKAAGCQ